MFSVCWPGTTCVCWSVSNSFKRTRVTGWYPVCCYMLQQCAKETGCVTGCFSATLECWYSESPLSAHGCSLAIHPLTDYTNQLHNIFRSHHDYLSLAFMTPLTSHLCACTCVGKRYLAATVDSFKAPTQILQKLISYETPCQLHHLNL